MSVDKLPEGWTRVKFGDVTSRVTESVRPTPEQSRLYIGLEHMRPDSYTITDWGSEVDLDVTKTPILRGDVLFARRNTHLRRCAVAPFDTTFSPDGYAIRTKDSSVLLQEFLLHVVASDGFMDYAVENSAGTHSKRVKWSSLERYEFPLPPIDEQQRIAALIGSVDLSLSSLAGAAAAAETLKQAQTFRVLSRSGRSVPLADLADVQYGLTLNARRAGLPVGYPYLRVANVQRGFIDLTEVKTVGCGDEEVETYTLADGDILVVEGHANIADVGRAAIWRSPALPAVLHQNHLLRVRATGQMNPQYLLAVLNSPLGRGYFASRAKSTSGLNTINSTVLRSFPVPVIDLDEQEDLVRRLSSADDLLGVLDRDVSATRHLRQSLLADALEGRRVH